ncbi:MAG: head GIN domain-containing protein [Bacteroidota bacterium]
MKKLSIFLLILLPFTGYLSAQSSITRELPYFDEIEFGGAGKIFLVPGDEPRIEILSDKSKSEIVEDLVTEVSGGTLDIYLKEGKWHKDLKLVLTITYPALERLNIYGAGSVYTEAPIITDNFTLEVEGAEKAVLELDVKYVEVLVSGAGDIVLSGKARDQRIVASGAASVKAMDLITSHTEAELNGVGSIKVYASESLDAEVNGIGSIQYAGNPANVRSSKGGIGSIKAVN